MLNNLLNTVKNIIKVIIDIIRFKTEFVLGILFIVLLGVGLIYVYNDIFTALIKPPAVQENSAFLDRGLYKYFEDKISERHNINNNALIEQYRDIFK